MAENIHKVAFVIGIATLVIRIIIVNVDGLAAYICGKESGIRRRSSVGHLALGWTPSPRLLDCDGGKALKLRKTVLAKFRKFLMECIY